jgi:demethylmenaquinone methyltransferase/2-methoxy-6-polyprenyl-1,4-benzoquinol methylase
MEKIYPDSEVELTPFLAKHYDTLLNVVTLGFYHRFIRKAIAGMQIREEDQILDLGCGTGRNACLMYQYLSGGAVTGLDISEVMESHFRKKCAGKPGAEFIRQRIDIPFDLNRKFDKVFISFVLHGFPQEVREVVIRNAYNHLKEGGTFHILDYGEFDLEKTPAYIRIPFKKIECKYAFDYIRRDWKAILKETGFQEFHELKLGGRYARLLTARR